MCGLPFREPLTGELHVLFVSSGAAESDFAVQKAVGVVRFSSAHSSTRHTVHLQLCSLFVVVVNDYVCNFDCRAV